MGHWTCVCLKKKRDSGQQQHQNRLKANILTVEERQYIPFVTRITMIKTKTLCSIQSKTTPIAKIESIYKKGSKSQAFANIQLRGQTTDILVECNIDSGAEVNVMPLLYTNTCSQNRKTSMDDQSLYRNPRSV